MLSFCMKDSIFFWLTVWSRYQGISISCDTPVLMFTLDGVSHMLVESTRNKKSYWSWLNWRTKHLDGLFSNRLTPCKGPVILFFGIREIFARSIWNPGIWNLEYSSTGIQNQANYWNLGSRNHIAESSIQDFMDFLTWREIDRPLISEIWTATTCLKKKKKKKKRSV